ncbi:MAG: glycogen/starch synthase [Flavobacteriaceae bacterium]
MNGKRILFVSSELVPYLPENQVSLMSYESPRVVNGNGGQIRIFMPRYGNINERRHQLHEVIRLSGMNLVINDMDMPLIIKVASIPKERIQVYFIDNEEYFKRKATFFDADGKLFEDNDERAIFFAKGVVETVKKLNWAPDVIHVHGWMASLLPLYLRTYYKDEPIFADAKIVTSVYEQGFEGNLNTAMKSKIAFDGVETDVLEGLSTPNFNNLLKTAIDYSDGIIFASESVSEELETYGKSKGIPTLDFCPIQETEEAYLNFYNNEVL